MGNKWDEASKRKKKIFKLMVKISILRGHDLHIDWPVLMAICKKCGKPMNIDIDFGDVYDEQTSKDCKFKDTDVEDN